MNFKEIFKETLEDFFIIFTVAIVINAINNSINGMELISTHFIFGILLVSALTSLAGVVFYSKNELDHKKYFSRLLLHYVLVMAIVLAAATYFQWLVWSSPVAVISFMALVTVIYVVVHVLVFLQTKKLADKLNRKLNERYKK